MIIIRTSIIIYIRIYILSVIIFSYFFFLMREPSHMVWLLSKDSLNAQQIQPESSRCGQPHPHDRLQFITRVLVPLTPFASCLTRPPHPYDFISQRLWRLQANTAELNPSQALHAWSALPTSLQESLCLAMENTLASH